MRLDTEQVLSGLFCYAPDFELGPLRNEESFKQRKWRWEILIQSNQQYLVIECRKWGKEKSEGWLLGFHLRKWGFPLPWDRKNRRCRCGWKDDKFNFSTLVKAVVFQPWMWELDCEESWVPKNWCFWTVVLEKTLESPLDCKEIQPIPSKGDRSLVFIGRTDAKAETPILQPSHVKSWLIGKDPDTGRDWGQEEKGTTEDEMAGWHHRLDGHEFG